MYAFEEEIILVKFLPRGGRSLFEFTVKAEATDIIVNQDGFK